MALWASIVIANLIALFGISKCYVIGSLTDEVLLKGYMKIAYQKPNNVPTSHVKRGARKPDVDGGKWIFNF
jgi:hypothetical protein